MNIPARTTLISLMTVFITGVLHATPVTGFGDLTYWGSGPNQSALILDWKDAGVPESLAWGYNWSGSLTVGDMLLNLVARDPKLFARIDSSTGFGLGLFGLGVQKGTGAFGLTAAQDPAGASADPVSFVGGVHDLNTSNTSVQAPASSAGVSASQSGDYYQEGWNDNGFWGFSLGGASATLPGAVDWTAAVTGVGGETLADGHWYALVFKPGFSGTDNPGSPVNAAIPEPTTAAILLAGLGALIWLRHASRYFSAV